jgi:hypothetical protein
LWLFAMILVGVCQAVSPYVQGSFLTLTQESVGSAPSLSSVSDQAEAQA